MSANYHWYRFEDVCGINIGNPLWCDYIGLQCAYFFKNGTTNKYDTRDKVKWGKSGKKSYDWSSDPNTRHKDKQRYKKELSELGFKHIPTNIQYQLEDK